MCNVYNNIIIDNVLLLIVLLVMTSNINDNDINVIMVIWKCY